MPGLFFLVPSLPPLTQGEVPKLRFNDFLILCRANLGRKEYEQLSKILLLADIENLRSLHLKNPWDPTGSLDKVELEGVMQEKSGIPKYFIDFLDEYDTKGAQIKHFPRLVSEYFKCEEKGTDGFLKTYLDFARKFRLILAAIRCKKLGRPVEEELRYESTSSPLVAHILAQKDADNYEPPEEFEELKRIFSEHFQDPTALSFELIRYQWEFVVENTINEPFTLDYVLGYCVLLGLHEKAFSLDQNLSQEILEDILKG